MNKLELKRFAVEARRDLIEKVSLKAEQYGINKENQTLRIEEKYGELVINGRTYPIILKNALKTMESKLKKVGYEQLIEEVAYTWFNRVTAIRYMEVNGHLPERVNVLSSTTGKAEPDIIFNYETMELDINNDEIRSLLSEEKTERAYRTLFVAQCNALNKVMPFLFEQIEDYTELLLPDYLLDKQSIIRKITEEVSEENFYELEENGSKKDNVEILGWLYQYYMSEKKEKVGGLKNNAVKKEDLPVVTQLFTPKWIVQYMVQNSLGKLYDEKYEDNNLSKHWEYYLKNEENHHLYPEFDSLEELKIMDPACGSGHILLYAFDMLYDMYQEAGYPSRDIPQLILENNLYGLDIDKRSQQIANFALMMKAVEKQPRLLSKLHRKKEEIKINVYEIVDADQSLSEEAINYFVKDDLEKQQIKEIMVQFEHGKQFGSLIKPIRLPYRKMIDIILSFENQYQDLINESYIRELREKLLPILKQAILLYEKHDVVVTNPPYHNKYNPLLKKFMNSNYKDYKSDLYSAFVYSSGKMIKKNGYSALMTPYTWMFISTHEKLRSYLLEEMGIASLVELEYSSFKEATVPICTFILHKQKNRNIGKYVKLSEFKGSELQPIKLKEAVTSEKINYKYSKNSKDFLEIPNKTIAYWAEKEIINMFRLYPTLSNFFESAGRTKTHDNEKYVRFFWEISNDWKNWSLYANAGGYKKYYGEYIYVVNWSQEAQDTYKKKGGLSNKKFWNRKGITWNMITSVKNGFIVKEKEAQYSSGSPTIMLKDLGTNIYSVIAFLNSNIGYKLIDIINPTLNTSVGDVLRVPYKFENETISLVKESISITKDNFDNFETSKDFKFHPLIADENQYFIKIAFSNWDRKECSNIELIKQKEEKINEILIDHYSLSNSVSSEIDSNDITLIRITKSIAVKTFLSYFIGCVLGRYSLDIEGIAYAGGEFYEEKYRAFKPNKEGLIQFTEKQYFENDIIVRLKEFLAIAFSKDTVDENIKWLAESLMMRKNESPEDRLRRYFMDEFFKDHCKTYQKRPIYWLVDSGKQKGLRTLIYMHRYQPDTMATIRFEHLQEIQSKYQNEIEVLEIRLSNPDISASDRKNLEKSKESYQKKIEELQEFDKKLAVYANNPINLDLDDGVKVNYAKFDDVLAKIK